MRKNFFPFALVFGIGAGLLLVEPWWRPWRKPVPLPQPQALVVALSPDYPPFEFYKKGTMQGLDVDLAHLLGKELGVAIHLRPMAFSMIFVSLSSGIADLGISCIVATPQRRKYFDFSTPYFQAGMALVWQKPHPTVTIKDLPHLRLGCQLGTTMRTWLEVRFPKAHVNTMENNLHVIEALRAGHIDVAVLESLQAEAFCKKDPSLSQAPVPQHELGDLANAFCVALAKNSPWTPRVNAALARLKTKGELERLRKTWAAHAQ